ncbi:hypothetical protein EVAR_91878_1 [Eumeta japonica]|uniref:Uncharacterized protein n=1 Tax=Eumeta variegata TaxID=151549 RepID=A0A4C1T095_EUMVA|nr:hypothetical protein EVAR_91878_1 [Eumeta japonica]
MVKYNESRAALGSELRLRIDSGARDRSRERYRKLPVEQVLKSTAGLEIGSYLTKKLLDIKDEETYPDPVYAQRAKPRVKAGQILYCLLCKS